MRPGRLVTALVAAASTLAVTFSLAPAVSADGHTLGNRSLAEVLDDGDDFDKRKWDYDIVYQAVLAVLAAKPESPVGALTDGDIKLTAFVPSDHAFRKLAKALTGKWIKKEADVFAAVAGLGIDTVEQVLLYHVVVGDPIDFDTAITSNGAKLETALGETVKVKVKRHWVCTVVMLVDKDPDSRNPLVYAPDINAGNKQIAHGITRVLRPMDIPRPF